MMPTVVRNVLRRLCRLGGPSNLLKQNSKFFLQYDADMIKKNAPVKIAVMQCASARGNVEANLHELERCAGLASADGVDLLITPEMYISG